MTHKMLGIVGCLLMEDEIVYTVSRDDDISKIYVVDNEDRRGITEKLSSAVEIPISLVAEDKLTDIPQHDGISALIWMKDMALHEEPEKLKEDMKETLSALEGVCQSVIAFYGLCGNALKDIDSWADEINTPVTILRDSRGEIVDDCIAAVVGGREPYQKLVSEELGIFFLTPMWALNWREMAEKTRVVPNGHDDRLMKIVLDSADYKKVMKIETGIGEQEAFDEKAEEFARIFELKKVSREGDLTLIEGSYRRAKERLVS